MRAMRIQFTNKQRLVTGICMLIAFLGLGNVMAGGPTPFALSPKQTAMMAFVPLIVVLYLILNYDKLR